MCIVGACTDDSAYVSQRVEGCSCGPPRRTGAGASARVEWGVEGEFALKKVV